jgi:hypothetical protein
MSVGKNIAPAITTGLDTDRSAAVPAAVASLTYHPSLLWINPTIELAPEVTEVTPGLLGSVIWFVPDEQTTQTTAFVVFTRLTLLQLTVSVWVHPEFITLSLIPNRYCCEVSVLSELLKYRPVPKKTQTLFVSSIVTDGAAVMGPISTVTPLTEL